jgi:hypothetical protein
MLASFGMEALIAVVALVGVILMIFTIVYLALGRVHLCYRPAVQKSSAFIESFAIYLGGYLVIAMLIRRFLPNAGFANVAISIGWIPLAMLWPLARGVSWAGLKGAYGWYVASGVVKEAAWGMVGYLAGVPIVIVAAIISTLIASRTHTQAIHPIIFADVRGLWHIVELFLLASVFAPLVEETMFRGAFFNHLRQWHGWLLSALVSSFVFAAMHPQGWADIPVLGAIGLVFAGIREWRGTFIASATAHAVHNGVAITMLVLVLR